MSKKNKSLKCQFKSYHLYFQIVRLEQLRERTSWEEENTQQPMDSKVLSKDMSSLLVSNLKMRSLLGHHSRK